jgi:hypothetical protein
VEPPSDNVLFLGLIVLIRTVLSFFLEIEIDGPAPWRRASMCGADCPGTFEMGPTVAG